MNEILGRDQGHGFAVAVRDARPHQGELHDAEGLGLRQHEFKGGGQQRTAATKQSTSSL